MVKLTKIIKEVLSEKQLISNFKKWIGKNNYPTTMDIDWYAKKENLTPEQKSILKKTFPPDDIKIKSTGPVPDDVRFRNK